MEHPHCVVGLSSHSEERQTETLETVPAMKAKVVNQQEVLLP